jgi:serine/threonine protein kinase
MNCPRCDSPAETQALQQFGGVCPKCLLEFAAEKDAPSFPNLEIVSTLGEGGMGVVYKAVQKPLGRTVALKVLSPQLAADPAFVERFTREAKALASLNHPNIVAIHDFGVHDGVPYLLMEHVDGTPLRKMLAAKKLTAEQALDVVPQICDALQYAHARGVVHRDVKPENILIDREGRVKIADFGLAKLAAVEQTRITRTNMLMGTPHYMAPEQIENPSTVDHRADIYSLGVIFYEMLTGELPLGRFKPPSQRASTDRRLDPVVMKSLEKEPGDRYQSAGEVKEHVTRLDKVPTPGPRSDVGLEESPHFSFAPLIPSAILGVIALGLALDGERSGALWTAVTAGIGAVTVSPAVFKRRTRSVEPHRAAPHPRRWPFWGGVFAGIVCLVAILVSTRVPSRSSARVVTNAPEPPPNNLYRLENGWPAAAALPEGLSYERQATGAEAVAEAKLPKEMLGDLSVARYARLTPGGIEIVGLRFSSQVKEDLWTNAPELEVGKWTQKGGAAGCILLLRRGSYPVSSPTIEKISLLLFDKIR